MCFVCRLLHPSKKKEEYVEPEYIKKISHHIPGPELPQDKPIPYFGSSGYPTTKYCNKCGQRLYNTDPKKHHGWVKGHPI